MPGFAMAKKAEQYKFLTVREVASVLRVTLEAVRARIQRGAIPGVYRTSERAIRIERNSFEAWLEGCREEATC